MDILIIDFESSLKLIKNGQNVVITAFKTEEHGNIKLGISAPKGLSIDREEVFLRKRESMKSIK